MGAHDVLCVRRVVTAGACWQHLGHNRTHRLDANAPLPLARYWRRLPPLLLLLMMMIACRRRLSVSRGPLFLSYRVAGGGSGK